MAWKKWDRRAIGTGATLWTWAGMKNNELWKNHAEKPWGLWFITGRTSDNITPLSKIVSHAWDLKLAAHAK